MVSLVHNAYGKQQVRASYVDRRVRPHAYQRLSIDTSVSGRFQRAYAEGQNAEVLPTDTMRAAVFDLLDREGFSSPEQFGLVLTKYLLTSIPVATQAEATVRSERWSPITSGDEEFADAFIREPGEWRATVYANPSEHDVWGGIEDVPLAKTARSAFRGFLRDELTVLEDDDDRVIGTTLNAAWKYASADVDFAGCSTAAQRCLLRAFATHSSESLQHTIYGMGTETLEACPEIERIRLDLPNYHHVQPDLNRGGIAEDGQPLVLRFEHAPHGRIEGELSRRSP